MRIKIEETEFSDFDFSDFSSFIFLFSSKQKTTTHKKIAIDEEKLESIDINGIGNLEDL